jgi:hypothetical protein
MRLKQFLKPDWRKPLLFIIIFILTHVAEIPSPWENIYAQATTNYGTVGIVLILIIDVIVTYLISCLIIWIYEKVKKKK